MTVHLAATEGHSECIRYLVEQLLTAKQHQHIDCPTTAITPHPVLGVNNNLGETPRSLAERFHKYDALETIDRLLEQSNASAPDRYAGISTIVSIIAHSLLTETKM